VTKQERAARTRTALIRAAAEEFERRGYAETTLNDISLRCGVSTGALHFHFDSKATLAATVEEYAEDDLRRCVATARSAARGTPGGALGELIQVSHRVMDALSANPVVRAGVRLGFERHRSGGRLRLAWQELVASLLRRARQEGELSDDAALDELETVLTALLHGLVMLSQESLCWLEPGRLGSFWRLVLPQIAAPQAAARPALPSGSAPVQ
jgi:AcrR family transcriptional regulator